MLHLEDFLELLEQLPGELKDRATDIRILDLQAQQLHEQANKERDEFFATGGNLPPDLKLKRYNEIMELYARAQAHADEKAAIADVTYNLMLKYSQKLNKEIHNFKLELEADNPGITEQIEQKFDEMERNIYLQRKERKRRMREATAGLINGNSGAPSDASSPGPSRAHQGHLGDSAEGGAEPTAQSHSSGSRSSIAAAGANEEEPGPSGSRPRGTTSALPPLKVIVKRSQLTQYPKGIAMNTAHSSPSMHTQPGTADRGDGWSGTLTGTPSTPSQVQFSLHPSKSTSSFAGSTAGISGHPSPNLPMALSSESRHGRVRKLTSRAQEYNSQRHERRATSTQSAQSRSPEPMQGSDDDSDSDKRVWCFCRDRRGRRRREQ